MKAKLLLIGLVFFTWSSFAVAQTALTKEAIQTLLKISNFDIPFPIMKNRLLAKAQPDECFNGIGNPYPELNSDGTCSEGIPKTNQAYLWGMTRVGDELWFGTGPNILCLVINGVGVGKVFNFSSSQNVICEGDAAVSGTGDLRPPKMYRYDTKTRDLKEVTPGNSGLVTGIRSAGSLGNIVFFAGPNSIIGEAGITMWAFNADTEELLGWQSFSEYNDIRKWIVYDGVLYTGVQNTAGGGSILRWVGDESNPFQFTVVASLPNAAANLAIYGKNRLAVSTWPSFTGSSSKAAGVYLSPVIPAGGFTAADADQPWKEVFLYSSYEPDPVIARTYAGGDLAYYDGWLYWGSMHVPGISTSTHMLVFGANAASKDKVLSGTWRATSVWRGKALNSDKPTIQLLYGEKKLPKYDFNLATQTGTKTFIDTATGWKPRYGKSGFGSVFNGYTWEMKVVNGSLFVGTLDISYLAGASNTNMFPYPDKLFGTMTGYGADLWRFDSSFTPAVLESRNGLGNGVNYGMRTMIVGRDGKTLYVGTANPFNLNSKGGWELRELTPKYSARYLRQMKKMLKARN